MDSRLVIAGQVVDAPNEKEEVQPTLGTLDRVLESVSAVLIDSGFYKEAAVKAVEGSSSGALAAVQVLAATERHKHGRSIADLEMKTEPAELPEAPRSSSR